MNIHGSSISASRPREPLQQLPILSTSYAIHSSAWKGNSPKFVSFRCTRKLSMTGSKVARS